MTLIVRTLPELQRAIDPNKRIGFVPTMGALHPGHLSLIRLAKKHAEQIVISIFVNQAQFAPHEDFSAYPRQEIQDINLLTQEGVDIIYLPDSHTMYPAGFTTRIDVGPIGQILEGTIRPHFFNGVALVVSKLLLQILPDIAVFGEKDYQQLIIIQQLVRDLNIPTTIIPGPTLRENDGLAMSSRNQYLTPALRSIAPTLFSTLQDIKKSLEEGQMIADSLKKGIRHLLEAGFNQVDYIQLCHPQTLQQVTTHTPNARILAAARLGTTRLIDNLPVWIQ